MTTDLTGDEIDSAIISASAGHYAARLFTAKKTHTCHVGNFKIGEISETATTIS
jgi:hypothetical protein